MSNKDRLLDDLRRRVLTMDLEPGAALDETKLSAEYGLSRTPLRDVFRQLAGEGYLVQRENRGTTVSPLSHTTMRDFMVAAPMIYAAVGRLAAEHATPEEIDALRETQAGFRRAVEAGAVEDSVFWNDRFHHDIGVMSKNPFLMPSLRRLLVDHARIGQTFWSPVDADTRARVESAVAHHERFIELIEARDAEGVVALTIEHFELSRDHVLRYVRPDPLPIDLAADR